MTIRTHLDKACNSKTRVGAVSYLNTKPLVCDLGTLAPNAEVTFDLPSRLADQLSSGDLDVALIPSVEFFHNPDYVIVSDACIGCRGPVLSVKLLSKVPMDAISTLALDEGSRTSAALSQVLLEQRFGIRPALEPFPIGTELSDVSTDAVLIIGDRAIADFDDYQYQWDLGDEWRLWSELPFVFAMWVARPGFDYSDIELALAASRDRGLANLEHIAQAEAAAHNMSPERCLTYLRDNLHFSLGAGEYEGLELFHRHAMTLGFAPSGSQLRRSNFALARTGTA